jgi:hypothetical protein
LPEKLEVNPAVSSTHIKETSHGDEEEEGSEEENQVTDDMRVSLWAA